VSAAAGVFDVSEWSESLPGADGEDGFTAEQAGEPAWRHDRSQQQRQLLLLHADISFNSVIPITNNNDYDDDDDYYYYY